MELVMVADEMARIENSTAGRRRRKGYAEDAEKNTKRPLYAFLKLHLFARCLAMLLVFLLRLLRPAVRLFSSLKIKKRPEGRFHRARAAYC
jgi:hypothetical protein